VPYSSGFSATVNGEPVEIEEVTYGFMAVKIPANTECNVVFTYETPGFSLGCKISLAAFCALLVYSCTILIFRRHRSAATLKRKENE
jgi:uncharacterized membrane protein YfhO